VGAESAMLLSDLKDSYRLDVTLIFLSVQLSTEARRFTDFNVEKECNRRHYRRRIRDER